MQKFELILKNEKQKLYNRLTVFILIINIAAISWFLFSFRNSTVEKTAGIITLILLFTTVAFVKFALADRRKVALFVVTACMIFAYWFMSGYWWVGIISACLFYLHFITKRTLTVSFYPDKIEYPSVPKRIIKWDELNNVILKDDWLTIDFKNNRIIQQCTEDSTPEGNEKEFNDFCRQFLNK